MKYIHPFPARMAPELALKSVRKQRANSIILDPMMGSGTVLREALIHGHTAIGYDLDPLALLISKVTNTPFDLLDFEAATKSFLLDLKDINEQEFELPWIDNDPETLSFINFWYAAAQIKSIRKIAWLIHLAELSGSLPDIYLNTLKIALSRIIITKEMKASLARDTAHSRPHRVSLSNDYNVLEGFELSIQMVIKILKGYFTKTSSAAEIFSGDAREMNNLADGSVDTIITSPPYLNAIDYLRGHKLSLVWFGYSLSSIRNIRNSTVGLEKLLTGDQADGNILNAIDQSSSYEAHSKKEQRTILKYAVDLNSVLGEYYRVLRPGGLATFVVANSNIKNKVVDNANILKLLAQNIGFELRENMIREIPSQGRYLPVSVSGTNPLFNRMKHESVMTFIIN